MAALRDRSGNYEPLLAKFLSVIRGSNPTPWDLGIQKDCRCDLLIGHMSIKINRYSISVL